MLAVKWFVGFVMLVGLAFLRQDKEILRSTCCQDEPFNYFSSIATTGAMHAKCFSIQGDSYVFVSQYYDGRDYFLSSTLYGWEQGLSAQVQVIATKGAIYADYFEIEGESYLVVGNHFDGENYRLNSLILQWNGTQFIWYQDLPTVGVRALKHFESEGEHYLVAANFRDETSHSVNSVVYQWVDEGLVPIQQFSTKGVHAVELFTIDDDIYLVVANHVDDTVQPPAYDTDSLLYLWSGSVFIEWQRLPTVGATSWVHFEQEDKHYLAVSNYFDGESYTGSVVIYQWQENEFSAIQSIPVLGAFAVNFVSGYLIIGGHYDGLTRQLDSLVYEGQAGVFRLVQVIPTQGASHLEGFVEDGQQYFFIANYFDDRSYEIESDVYVLENSGVTSSPSASEMLTVSQIPLTSSASQTSSAIQSNTESTSVSTGDITVSVSLSLTPVQSAGQGSPTSPVEPSRLPTELSTASESQAQVESNTASPTQHPSTSLSQSVSTSAQANSSSGLSDGILALVVILVYVVILIAGWLLVSWVYKRYFRSRLGYEMISPVTSGALSFRVNEWQL